MEGNQNLYPNLLSDGIIERIVTDIRNSNHQRAQVVTTLSRFPKIHALPKSVTLKCQDIFDRNISII